MNDFHNNFFEPEEVKELIVLANKFCCEVTNGGEKST